MNALLDTNIILDLLLNRQPFVELARKVLQQAQQCQIQLFMTATTITDVYYIARKEKGKAKTLEFSEDFLQFVQVVAIDKSVIIQALHADMADFEDAIQSCAAKQAAIPIIVTRNPDDFKKSGVDIHTPKSFVEKFNTDVLLMPET